MTPTRRIPLFTSIQCCHYLFIKYSPSDHHFQTHGLFHRRQQRMQIRCPLTNRHGLCTPLLPKCRVWSLLLESVLLSFSFQVKKRGHPEWSKSEREKHTSYMNAYLWNLEGWYRWSYLQSRNRDRDIGNKPMDNQEGKGRVGWTGRLGLTYIHNYA